MITRQAINTIIGTLNQTRHARDRTTIERGLSDCAAKVEALLREFEGNRDAANPAWRVLSEAYEHLLAAHQAAGVSQETTSQGHAILFVGATRVGGRALHLVLL